MATIIERDVHHRSDADASSAVNTIVAVLAVVLIVGFALYALQAFPFAGSNAGNNGGAEIHVDANFPTAPAPAAQSKNVA